MNDTYVDMLVDERIKSGIAAQVLCEGICTEDIYFMVERGERTMDRVSIKRLLARLGVDNGDYEHYVSYEDYEVWRRRMLLINSIEDGELAKAEEMLQVYPILEDNVKNKSRVNIEKQFYNFMKLQIMRCGYMEEYEAKAKELYEEAVKATVPCIDEKPLKKLLLSPVELNLLLEYKSRIYKERTLADKIEMYREILNYMDRATFGKLSLVKVYPKVVVYMYKDISDDLHEMEKDNQYKLYEELWNYCERSCALLRQRKSLLYMTELLEMRAEILCRFMEETADNLNEEEWFTLRNQTLAQLEALKVMYVSHCKEPYMRNDCYLYRESGMYCINDVVKIRRVMLDKTQEDMCDEDISISTVKRLEAKNYNIIKSKFKNLFEKLSLYPSYINMGLVSDKKEALDMYEELCFATTSFRYDDVDRLIEQLREILPNHKLNEQALGRLESLNNWRKGEVTGEEHINKLKELLELTIKLNNIQNAEKIFLTSEELMTLYLISVAYKEIGRYDEALAHIKEIESYILDIENQGLSDGRIGIYELILEYLASLYGDMELYDISNDISDKLIKMSLKLRRSGQIHPNIYNIAWNNNQCNKEAFDYNIELRKCIIFSQLTGDINDEAFYKGKLTS